MFRLVVGTSWVSTGCRNMKNFCSRFILCQMSLKYKKSIKITKKSGSMHPSWRHSELFKSLCRWMNSKGLKIRPHTSLILLYYFKLCTCQMVTEPFSKISILLHKIIEKDITSEWNIGCIEVSLEVSKRVSNPWRLRCVLCALVQKFSLQSGWSSYSSISAKVHHGLHFTSN